MPFCLSMFGPQQKYLTTQTKPATLFQVVLIFTFFFPKKILLKINSKYQDFPCVRPAVAIFKKSEFAPTFVRFQINSPLFLFDYFLDVMFSKMYCLYCMKLFNSNTVVFYWRRRTALITQILIYWLFILSLLLFCGQEWRGRADDGLCERIFFEDQ